MRHSHGHSDSKRDMQRKKPSLPATPSDTIQPFAVTSIFSTQGLIQALVGRFAAPSISGVKAGVARADLIGSRPQARRVHSVGRRRCAHTRFP